MEADKKKEVKMEELEREERKREEEKKRSQRERERGSQQKNHFLCSRWKSGKKTENQNQCWFNSFTVSVPGLDDDDTLQ